jgi:hypothetical protein
VKARPGPESLGIHGLTTASRRTPLRSAAEAEHGWAAEDCIFPQSWQSFAPAGGGSCHGPTRGSSRPPGRAVVSVLSSRRRRLNLAVGQVRPPRRRVTCSFGYGSLFAPAGGGSCHGPTRGSSRPPGRAVVSVLSLRRRRLNLAVGRRMTAFLPVMAVFCTGSGGSCHGPTRGSSRPPRRAVGSVLSLRRRRLNLAVGRRRTAFSSSHGSLLYQQAAVDAMAQHGVPADRLGVRSCEYSRQDGGG